MIWFLLSIIELISIICSVFVNYRFEKKLFKIKVFFLTIGLFVFGLVFLIQNSQAAITKEISYQGKLTNASNVAVPDGNYNMIISIYTVASGGTPVWTARGTVGAPTAKSVTVANGIFSTMLGETGDNPLNLDFSVSYWLGVSVNGDAEMIPRKKIGAASYAFNALNMISDGRIYLDNVATTNDAVNINYNPTSGTYDAMEIIYGSGGGTGTALKIAQNGNGAGMMITNLGSGISFRVNDETGENDTTPFLIDASGNVGVGTTTPGPYKLNVNGNSYFNGTADITGRLTITGAQDTGGNLRFSASNPYIYASSYIVMPSGLYVSDGTFYAQNTLMARGGIRDDENEDTFYESQQGMSFNIDYNNNDNDTEYFSWNKNGSGFGAGTELMRLTEGGNLGIGTTAPNSKLDIVSAGSTVLSVRTTNTTTDIPAVRIGQSNNYYGELIYDSTADYFAIRSVNNGTPNTGIYLPYNSSNVGIGTTSPLDKLNISSGNLRLSDSYKLAWGGTNNYILGSNASNYLALGTNNTERLRIDASGNVGIGTSSPTSKLEVAGNVTIGAFDGSATSWTLSRDGSGTKVRCSAVYNGKLYVGMEGDSSYDIYSYDGTTWTGVFNSATYEGAYSMAVYNGKLYVGMGSGADDGNVISYDGSSWTDAAYDPGASYESVESMAVYDGKLYIGLGNSAAGDGDIAFFNGSSWTLPTAAGACFNNDNTSYEKVQSMAVYNGKLYFGYGTTVSDGDVYVYDGNSSYAVSVSLNTANREASSMAVYNNKLYVGISATSTLSSFDGTSWSTVRSGVTTGGILSLVVYNGKLYVGTYNDPAGYISVLAYNGTNFSTIYSYTTTPYESFENLSVYKNKLYAGTGTGTGDADIFVYGENNFSNSLLFASGSGLSQKVGSLYFAGDEFSGTSGSPGSLPGVFKMSHSLITTAGLNVPDYVFEEDYDLMSLEKLEEFIKINKHLPNVASRDQISQYGMDYSQMILSVLEKTEENTLYLLEQNKKMKNFSTNLSLLDNKINERFLTLNTFLTNSIQEQQTQITALNYNIKTLNDLSLEEILPLLNNKIEQNQKDLALLTVNVNQQGMVLADQINTLSTAMAGNFLSVNQQLASLNNWVINNSAKKEILDFYIFNSDQEVASNLSNQIFDQAEKFFQGEYSQTGEYQEVVVEKTNSIDLSSYNYGSAKLRFQFFVEHAGELEDINVELGQKRDEQEWQWNKESLGPLQDGWNEVVLPIKSAIKTGEPDWADIRYFRVYFRATNQQWVKVKDLQIEVLPYASSSFSELVFDLRDYDLASDSGQGTALVILADKTNQFYQDLQLQESQLAQLNTNLTQLSELINGTENWSGLVAQVNSHEERLQVLERQILVAGGNIFSFPTLSVVLEDLGNHLNGYETEDGYYFDLEGNWKAKKIEAQEIKSEKVKAGDYVVTENQTTNQNNVGSIIIRTGEQEVLITNEKVKYNSKIIVTPVGHNPVSWVVSDKIDNIGFKIKLEKPAEFDIAFDYWIIGVE